MASKSLITFNLIHPAMKIGISSPYFCTTPFQKMLELISPHFEVWEIIGEHLHYLPDIVDEIRDVMGSYNVELQLHLPFSDINPASVVPRVRELSLDILTESMNAAADLGIVSMTLHAGLLSSINFRDRQWGLDVGSESCRKIYRHAEDLGVHINLENLPHKWMLGTSLEELEYLSEGFDPATWGLCYDIGHAFISGAQDDLLEHPDLVTNIHAHDNKGREDSHLAPGKGDIDFEAVARSLMGSKSDVVIMEANNLDDGIEGKKILTKIFR